MSSIADLREFTEKVKLRMEINPEFRKRIFWSVFCSLGLAVGTLMALLLEEFGGRPQALAFLTRLPSGPAIVALQKRPDIGWVVWEALVLYSLIQWFLIWGIGLGAFHFIPRLSFRSIAIVTFLMVGLIGLFFARTPGSSQRFFGELLGF